MTHLFDPITLRDLTLKNRVWVSPMCQYSSVDGVVGKWHEIHLGSFATGGPGMVMVEATGVVPEGRISTACPGIYNDQQQNALATIVDFSHSQGVAIGIQLAHAGRKGSCTKPGTDHPIATPDEGGWETVSASPIAFHGMSIPRELSIDEIHALTQSFADAAKRSIAAGFDLVEIHAAHGYLLHQFYSPLTNNRSDQYGGSFENRIRFLCEVTTAVRHAIPEGMPLFIRISASDWVEDGWSVEDSIELVKVLKELGADLIDVSSGGNVYNAKITTGPGYQLPFASKIREATGVAVSAVGMITEARQAEEIISSGSADAVFLARAMLRNPRWALNAAEELKVRIDWPIQLERGRTFTE
jgi:2,4-dienoyl-CoA reductase-like NADH-dependent reductase (Old Yellow Enzyme family)